MNQKKIKSLFVFFTFCFATHCVCANDGYMLISPERPDGKNDDVCFVIDCYDKKSGKLFNFVSVFSGKQRDPDQIKWLNAGRDDTALFFAADNASKGTAVLHSFDFKDKLIHAEEEFREGQILSGWRIPHSKHFVFLIWNGKDRSCFRRALPGDINKTAETEAEDFDVPSKGNSGGPCFHWNPSRGRFLFSHPEMTFPALKQMPPPELYQNRENPLWLLRGDIRKTFVLLYNPYHREVEQGQKSAAGIYFDKLKKWKILKLDGTECHPAVWDGIIVIQQDEQNAKSRPEQHLGYSPRKTGVFKLVDPDSGRIRTLNLPESAEILYADGNRILAKNGKELVEISSRDFWDGKCKLESETLLVSDDVVHMKSAVPRSNPPEKRHFLADEILQKEIIRNSCVLTREETDAAVKIYFEAEKISAEKFSSAAAMMRKLTEGLRLVAEKKTPPETVYSELNLARYGITEGNWTFYVSRYDTVPKIASLEQWIPDNADVLIKSACTQFKPMMEKFLLEQFVLCDFDAGNPTLTALPESGKTALWWTKRLDDYSLPQEDKEKIILFFERSRTPAKQQAAWKQIFRNRLQKQCP